MPMNNEGAIPEIELSRYVSIADASVYLGLSKSTIYRWLDSGEISFFRLPNGWRRIPREEVYRIESLLS